MVIKIVLSQTWPSSLLGISFSTVNGTNGTTNPRRWHITSTTNGNLKKTKDVLEIIWLALQCGTAFGLYFIVSKITTQVVMLNLCLAL